MRNLGLLSCLLSACCITAFAVGDSSSARCRRLTAVETSAKTAGTFHYCSWTMPASSACDVCQRSGYEDSIEIMPGMWVRYFLYRKCVTTQTNSVCWQNSFTIGPPLPPTPTCDLNPASCPGFARFYWDSPCTSVDSAFDNFQMCSRFNPTGYMAGTSGIANGVNCGGMAITIFTN